MSTDDQNVSKKAKILTTDQSIQTTSHFGGFGGSSTSQTFLSSNNSSIFGLYNAGTRAGLFGSNSSAKQFSFGSTSSVNPFSFGSTSSSNLPPTLIFGQSNLFANSNYIPKGGYIYPEHPSKKRKHQKPTNTNAEGPTLEFLKDMTKKDLVALHTLLSTKFTEFYSKNVTVGNCDSDAGGLAFTSGTTGNKSMRFRWAYSNRNKHKNYYNFQELKGLFGAYEANSDDDIIVRKGTTLSTSLRSYDGAPIWTLDELEIFKDCLGEFAVCCTKMPTRYYP